MHDATDQQTDRNQPAKIEGQDAHDQRRAEIGAKQQRQSHRHGEQAAGNEAAGDHRHRGRALQHHRHRRSACYSVQRAAFCLAEQPAQQPRIGALHPGAHHVHGIEQQQGRACEMQQEK